MRRNLILILAALGAAAPAHAQTKARTDISPYIEVGQVLVADLDDDGEVLTYTTIAAGVDAVVQTRRAEVQASYRYERRIDYDDDLADEDVHSGLARASVKLVPDLSFEAGALATRARADIRGAAPEILTGDVENISQVYSAYAGPTLATNLGKLDVTASYRLGYTKVEESTEVTLPIGQQRLDSYDDATGHLVTARVGMRPGELPFGWQVSGGYEREDAGQLDQRYEGKYVRGDVTVPVTPTLALVGGVGYEDIEISQRDAVRDASGAPVIDDEGRFVTDRASSRQLAYDQDGLIYDAGVLWRPSKRTQLEARVGRRYGGTTYYGSLQHQLSPASGVSIVVYDDVTSFGRLLNDNVSRLPTSFNVARNPLTDQFGGCVFAGAGQGGCLNDVFQSINTSNFRSRGITGLYTASRGPLSLGLGAGYSRRRYFAPRFGTGFTLDGVVDENWFAEATAGYQISAEGSLSGSATFNYFDSGIAGAPEVTSLGATGAYSHSFSRRLTGTAAAGLYSFDQEGVEDALTASALLAMQLRF